MRFVREKNDLLAVTAQSYEADGAYTDREWSCAEEPIERLYIRRQWRLETDAQERGDIPR